MAEKVGMVDLFAHERAKAFLQVAEVCRKQAVHVSKSGWGFFSRRCAVLNLEGIADLCQDLALNAYYEKPKDEIVLSNIIIQNPKAKETRMPTIGIIAVALWSAIAGFIGGAKAVNDKKIVYKDGVNVEVKKSIETEYFLRPCLGAHDTKCSIPSGPLAR